MNRALPSWLPGDVVVAVVIATVLALQYLAVEVLDPAEAPFGFLRRIMLLSPVALLPVLFLRFRGVVGAWVIAAGILMNVLPMAAHGGLMPVSYERLVEVGEADALTEGDIGRAIPGSKNVLLHESDIRFEPLSDKLRTELFGIQPLLFSAGDAVELGGVVLAAVQIIASTAGLRPFRPIPVDDPNPG